MDDGEQRLVARPRTGPLVRWILGILVGMVATWVAVRAAGGLSDAADAVADIDARWLIPAFIVEAVSYVVLGAKLQRLVGPEHVSLTEGVELGLVVSGFGLLTPATPAPGLAIAMGHLHRRGLARRHVAFAFGFAEWFSLRVFLLVSSLNVVAVALLERDSVVDLLPFLAVAMAVIALLALSARLALRPAAAERFATMLGALRRPSRRRSVEDRRAAGAEFHRDAIAFAGSPRRRAVLMALTASALLGDVGCLWFALLGAGAHVGFDVALLAITVSSFSILVPLVPGGLGIAEATIPAVAHHFGVPYDQGLAAALVYRGLGTFLPATLGIGAIAELRRRVPVASDVVVDPE